MMLKMIRGIPHIQHSDWRKTLGWLSLVGQRITIDKFGDEGWVIAASSTHFTAKFYRGIWTAPKMITLPLMATNWRLYEFRADKHNHSMLQRISQAQREKTLGNGSKKK